MSVPTTSSMEMAVAEALATQFGLVWSQMSDAPFSDGVDDHLSRPFWLEMAREAIGAIKDWERKRPYG